MYSFLKLFSKFVVHYKCHIIHNVTLMYFIHRKAKVAFCAQNSKPQTDNIYMLLISITDHIYAFALLWSYVFLSELQYTVTSPHLVNWTDMRLSMWFLNLSETFLFHKCRYSRGEWMDLLIFSGAGETTVEALVSWVGNSGWVRFSTVILLFFQKPRNIYTLYTAYFHFHSFPHKEYQFNCYRDFELHSCTLSPQEMTSFTLSQVIHQWACGLTCVQEMTQPLLIMPTSVLAQKLTTMHSRYLDTLALLVRENIPLCMKQAVFVLRGTIWLSTFCLFSGDSMKYHNSRPFSTKDKDPNILSIHCAKAYMGGWWYKNCYKANLNGLYASYSDNKVLHHSSNNRGSS